MARLRLEFLSGPRRGDAAVFSASPVSLGRSRSNTLVLPETIAPAASGRHAEFVLDGGAWWLVDQGATNGTLLNGTRVSRARIARGDRVTVGEVELEVGFVDEAAGKRTGLAVRLALVAFAAAAIAVAAYLSTVSHPGSPRYVADIASRSVYLVAIERQGRRNVVGTAFAVSNDGLLATNAHVAAVLERLLAGGETGASAVAVRGDTYDAHLVRSVVLHPLWRADSIAHDVALLRLAAPATSEALPLASASQVQGLRRGTSLSSFGFPAVSTDANRPRGRLSVDVVSDTRLPFLEVGLGISPGTSGSPVFGPDGSVVAVVVSGDFVASPKGAPARPSGSNANWAITVDELRDLLSAPPSR